MTPKAPQTLESAEAERDRLVAESRAAGEIADALAAERWAALSAKRSAWAETVLAEFRAVEADLAKAETTARRSFAAAAVAGDARSAFLEWIDTRNQVNVQGDRVVQARAILGEEQGDAGYVHRDVPSYSGELDRALGAEASSRFADRQTAFQGELNALDVLP